MSKVGCCTSCRTGNILIHIDRSNNRWYCGKCWERYEEKQERKRNPTPNPFERKASGRGSRNPSPLPKTSSRDRNSNERNDESKQAAKGSRENSPMESTPSSNSPVPEVYRAEPPFTAVEVPAPVQEVVQSPPAQPAPASLPVSRSSALNFVMLGVGVLSAAVGVYLMFKHRTAASPIAAAAAVAPSAAVAAAVQGLSNSSIAPAAQIPVAPHVSAPIVAPAAAPVPAVNRPVSTH